MESWEIITQRMLILVSIILYLEILKVEKGGGF